MTVGVDLSDAAAPDTGEGKDASATQSADPGKTSVTGSGGDQTGSTGSPTGSDTGADNTSPWYDNFKDTALKEFAKSKGWTDPEAQLKSHMELDKAFSSTRPVAPPADPKEYKFSNAPEGVTVPEEVDTAIRSLAHKAGIDNDRADKLRGAYLEFYASQQAAFAEAQTQQITETVEAAQSELEAAFKAKAGSPMFNRQVEMAKRAMRNLHPDLADALKSSGVIAEVGGKNLVANAVVFAALAKVGTEMYAEDTIHGSPAYSVNPFDPKTVDMRAQADLMRNDPEKAKQFIRLLAPADQAMWRTYLNKK